MLANFDLFTTQSECAGFRLNYLEILNWGTFNGMVYKIAPQGNHSLLTGANASGKSTLIDALLTLLVPAKKDRFYNQSSGNEKKGDRSEETYVLGHFGKFQAEGEINTKTQQLREKNNAYSVILASFNNNQQQIVTLFQLRWFINNELKCVYGFSTKPLTIENDFQHFNGKLGDLKIILEKKYNHHTASKQIEFYDRIQAYKEKIIRSFGLRSDRALVLFNQMVGVKVLDDLDNFIRHNMLEQKNAEDEYIKLNDTFAKQMAAKISIEKVKEQINQLQKIDNYAVQLNVMKQALIKLQSYREQAVFWFAQKHLNLADDKIAQLEIQLVELSQKIDTLNDKKSDLQQQERNLDMAIQNNDIGRRINELEKEIKALNKEKDERHKQLNKYNQTVLQVGLPENPSQDLFERNRHLAQQKEMACKDELKQQRQSLRYLENEQDRIDETIQENMKTLDILQKNQNNISGRVAEIRQMIVDHIGVKCKEIPFVGELVKVKENEQDWENTIEKLLHHFALRLIVPEKHYQAVNQFVNTHHLQGRIVYHRYEEILLPQQQDRLPENCLFHKLAFKDDSPYCEWVKQHILRQYNYACVSSIDKLNHYREKAMTQQGLIKSTNNKYEKDDRPQVNRRENYVLGWNNQAKIQAIQSQVRVLQQQKTQQLNTIHQLNQKIQKNENNQQIFRDIHQNFPDFTAIYWQEKAKIIQEKITAKKDLEEHNEELKSLKNQLDKVKQELSHIENQIEKHKQERWQKTGEQNQAQQRKSKQQAILEALPLVDCTALVEEYAQNLEDMDYDNIAEKQHTFQAALKNQEESDKDKKNEMEQTLTTLMNKFKNPPAHITQQFKDWHADTNSLPENVAGIDAYQKLYQRLCKEDLVRYEKQYNDFLQQHISTGIQDFSMFFSQWQQDIKETIAMLNKSLRAIDFGTTPPTYIQLMYTPKKNVDIQQFRTELDQALPNLHQINSQIDGRRIHFEEKIQPFMAHLQDSEWRKKVMDVRNWFAYKAEEFYQQDGQKYKTYESMGQLSGGEKAQLTYTILGSAIAYQFGLTQDGLNSKSLRCDLLRLTKPLRHKMKKKRVI